MPGVSRTSAEPLIRAAPVLASLLFAATVVAPFAHAAAPLPNQQQPGLNAPAPFPIRKPRVELVFVLDTTGSMGGLIDGARREIWSVANQVLKAKQKPEVRIGLVAYRDKGDAYVTPDVALTADLDRVFEKLMAMSADGGGDDPKHVNATGATTTTC